MQTRRKRSFVQWMTPNASRPNKVYSCPIDKYVLHWLEQEKQYICVRCGHRYDPKSETHKPKVNIEEQFLTVAGSGLPNKKPIMVQPTSKSGSRSTEYLKRRHGEIDNNWDNDIMEHAPPGFKITSSFTLTRGKTGVITRNE